MTDKQMQAIQAMVLTMVTEAVAAVVNKQPLPKKATEAKATKANAPKVATIKYLVEYYKGKKSGSTLEVSEKSVMNMLKYRVTEQRKPEIVPALTQEKLAKEILVKINHGEVYDTSRARISKVLEAKAVTAPKKTAPKKTATQK